MPTRQQRRAKARVPVRRKRRGQSAFLAVLVAIMLGGGAAIFLVRAQRPETPQRGAMVGEHWHAAYQIEICGARMAPYPPAGEQIHSHGDGLIHIHPSLDAFAGNNANLGAFFTNMETQIGTDGRGRRFMQFPDGKRYTDGDRCPDGKPYKWQFIVNGKELDSDPSRYVLHDRDRIILRFGPKAGRSARVIENPLKVTPPPHPTPAA